MTTWTYKTHPVHSHADLPEECTHIVYLLGYSDGTKYVGYKTVRSDRRMKPLKDMRKNAKRIVRKDLPFVKYTGSSKYNEGKELVSKEILHLCSNKRTATYLEVKEMIVRGSVEPDSGYNNENILGKFFNNCLDGLIKD
jgi:hypothetical protein